MTLQSYPQAAQRRAKAVIWRLEKVTELDHVFMSIQQHNCGESEELINKHLKPAQRPGCLRHVMSEAHRLLHSGCLWVCIKSPSSLVLCRPAALVILWFPQYNRILIRDTTCGLHVHRNQSSEGCGLFCICSLHSITWDNREKQLLHAQVSVIPFLA